MSCDEMIDRMPLVLAHRDTWRDEDWAHLRSCDECAESWRITSAGARVAATVRVDATAISAAVSARLAAPEPAPRIVWQRIAWPVAIAAAFVLVAYSAMVRRDANVPADENGAVATIQRAPLFPELEPLSEPALRVLLASVEATDTVGASSTAELPRLGDLTESQLEQLLITVESE